ncbi:MAG: alpha/beta hydrolase, partial [Ruminococcus sp.]|nr:alpha/beta hydrolase [Candidatus Apopatosoma intestinale]
SAVLIFPGGGYYQLSVAGEGIDVAKAFNKQGISVFVLRYRIKPYGGKAILADALRAVSLVREILPIIGVSDRKFAVCGFSAGAHLAMLTCQHSDDTIRPNLCILGSAVTTLGDGTFCTMPPIFLGENASDASLLARYSFSYRAEAMPPTFIWYSELDAAVNYHKNSLALAASLKSKNIPCECHGFPDGAHGSGLGFPECGKWLGLSVMFMKRFLK